MEQYNGSLTREQFMFREMRVVARLCKQGYTDEQIENAVIGDNLFQYPTERYIKGKCRVAMRRLKTISSSEYLLDCLAEGEIAEAKQAALVAMMCDSRLLAEFMLAVIGEKYRTLDTSLSQKDVNMYFERLCEQDEKVAQWSASTVKRIKSVLMNVLRENAYLEGLGSERLQMVMVSAAFASALRQAGLGYLLPAFNVLDVLD